MNEMTFGNAAVRRALVLLSVFWAAAAAVPAQENVIRIDTQLAVFEVLVEDAKGKPVYGLRPGEFRVFEDGVERPVDFFQPVKGDRHRRPLALVFAVDVSGSMTAQETENLRRALEKFIDRFGDYETYFALISFAMDVKVLQGFTNRPDVIRRSLGKIRRDQDGLSTHAYDAIDDAIRMITNKAPRSLRGRAPRRAVIAITDGFPVGDVVSPRLVIERANQAETSIYGVILPSFSPLARDTRPLTTPFEASGIVQNTGGKSLFASDNYLDPIFNSIAEELTASYAIAFYPREDGSAGPRTVRIESKSGYTIKQNRTRYDLSRR